MHWCVRRGLLLRQVPVTCWPCPVTTLLFFSFFFFKHTVTMDFHSNHRETAHTIITPTRSSPAERFSPRISPFKKQQKKPYKLPLQSLINNWKRWILISVLKLIANTGDAKRYLTEIMKSTALEIKPIPSDKYFLIDSLILNRDTKKYIILHTKLWLLSY